MDGGRWTMDDGWRKGKTGRWGSFLGMAWRNPVGLVCGRAAEAGGRPEIWPGCGSGPRCNAR